MPTRKLCQVWFSLLVFHTIQNPLITMAQFYFGQEDRLPYHAGPNGWLMCVWQLFRVCNCGLEYGLNTIRVLKCFNFWAKVNTCIFKSRLCCLIAKSQYQLTIFPKFHEVQGLGMREEAHNCIEKYVHRAVIPNLDPKYCMSSRFKI